MVSSTSRPLVLYVGPPRLTRLTGRKRRGAVSIVQVVILAPILIGGLFALIEFGMILNAHQRVKSASVAACRAASVRCDDVDAQAEVVQREARRVLAKDKLVRNCDLRCELGEHTGDQVVVEIRVPMKHAAPNLLAIVGFSLEDREIVATTTMRKE